MLVGRRERKCTMDLFVKLCGCWLGCVDICGITRCVVSISPLMTGHDKALSCVTVCEVDADLVSTYYHPLSKLDSPV